MFCSPLCLNLGAVCVATGERMEHKVSHVPLFLGQKHKLVLDVEIWETLAQADDDHQVVERENIK